MGNKRYILAMILAAGFLIGCNTNAPEGRSSSEGSKDSTETVSLSVSPTKLTVTGFYMKSEFIYIKCNTSWDVTIENEEMFESVNPRYCGTGDFMMAVTFPEISYNKQSSFTTQYGSITISCRDKNWRTISKKVECVRKKY